MSTKKALDKMEYTIRKSSIRGHAKPWIIIFAGLVIDRYTTEEEANFAANLLNNPPIRKGK